MKHIKKFNESSRPMPDGTDYGFFVISAYDRDRIGSMFPDERYYHSYVKQHGPIALVNKRRISDLKREPAKYAVHVLRNGEILVATMDDRKASIEELADYLGETDIDALKSSIKEELSKWEMKPVEIITFVKKR
jgi:hypothetical protein